MKFKEPQLAKYADIELKELEYIYVWDSCGKLGWSIPWPEWKAVGLLPIGMRNQRDEAYVHLYQNNYQSMVDKYPYENLGCAGINIDNDLRYFADGTPDWTLLAHQIYRVAKQHGLISSKKHVVLTKPAKEKPKSTRELLAEHGYDLDKELKLMVEEEKRRQEQQKQDGEGARKVFGYNIVTEKHLIRREWKRRNRVALHFQCKAGERIVLAKEKCAVVVYQSWVANDSDAVEKALSTDEDYSPMGKIAIRRFADLDSGLLGGPIEVWDVRGDGTGYDGQPLIQLTLINRKL